MKTLYLYNTLSRKKEEFKPIKKCEVGLYTCGPTVYNYAHIGNLRTYIFEDILKRVLKYNGYDVKHIMNITDVGHLTGDMDMGEDKMEKGAKREGKSAWEVAKFYEKAFIDDLKKLNIEMPDKWTRATEYINEQIDLIEILEKKGYVYKISDGIYFDTSKFADYNKLSHLDIETLREGARVEKNEEKKNPTDFALWKFSPPGEKRQMEWWFSGVNKGQLVSNSECIDDEKNKDTIGFPGWHIECSAMSKALLGDQLDIHCGGIDHINVHHTNEIAQSEAAYEKPFFNYWLHGAFLNIQGGKKMAKSEGNFLTLKNTFLDKKIDALVYRFAALGTHYRKPMEYSEEAMLNAEKGLNHLYNQVRNLGVGTGQIISGIKDQFIEALNDDLNIPKALAVVQEMLKSKKFSNEDKRETFIDFDRVLGFDITKTVTEILPREVSELKKQRQKAREEKNWQESDRIRDEIEKLGYAVEDVKGGKPRIFKK